MRNEALVAFAAGQVNLVSSPSESKRAAQVLILQCETEFGSVKAFVGETRGLGIFLIALRRSTEAYVQRHSRCGSFLRGYS